MHDIIHLGGRQVGLDLGWFSFTDKVRGVDRYQEAILRRQLDITVWDSGMRSGLEIGI